MANFLYHKLFSTIFVLIIVNVNADSEADLKAFVELKKDVFGTLVWINDDRFNAENVGKNIQKMMKLLKSGNIPAEVQGKITFDYLNATVTDCKGEETCKLEEDLARVDRLNELHTDSYNFGTYLNSCAFNILKVCADTVYKQARHKMSLLKEKDWDSLRLFAATACVESPGCHYGIVFRSRCPSPDLDYHKVTLKTLRALDPVASNMVAKKLIKKKESLKDLMDKVRLPCVNFLQALDPAAKRYPKQTYDLMTQQPLNKLMVWNFFKENCQNLVDQWEDIVHKAKDDYAVYLVDPRSRFWKV